MEPQRNILTVPTSIIVAALIVSGAWLLKSGGDIPPRETGVGNPPAVAGGEELVVPLKNLGQKLISVGALDSEAFLSLYAGAEWDEAKRLLETDAPITVTKNNARIVLNLLWGLGLAQKSPILERGMMTDRRFGGAEQFASTAGWTIAKGNAMEHYSRHLFMRLSPEQEQLAARVASAVYRPCCDNAADFPDCNHGMAMLGLLEILASEGRSEDELFAAALAANRLWFPDQYALIGEYETFLREKGGKGQALTSRELVGRSIAGASGFTRLAAARASWGVPRAWQNGGGGECGISAESVPAERGQSGCGI